MPKLEELWTQHDIDTFKPTPNAPRMPRKSARKSMKKIAISPSEVISTTTCLVEAKKILEKNPDAVAIDGKILGAIMVMISDMVEFGYEINGTMYTDESFKIWANVIGKGTNLPNGLLEDIIDILRMMFTKNAELVGRCNRMIDVLATRNPIYKGVMDDMRACINQLIAIST